MFYQCWIYLLFLVSIHTFTPKNQINYFIALHILTMINIYQHVKNKSTLLQDVTGDNHG